jgi:hypothetical protein
MDVPTPKLMGWAERIVNGQVLTSLSQCKSTVDDRNELGIAGVYLRRVWKSFIDAK